MPEEVDRDPRPGLAGRTSPAPTALEKYATERGALFLPVSGEEAQAAVQPAIRRSAWILQDSGKAKVSPEQLGIPRP